MPSLALRNVALLGATGNLGSHILKALMGAGYAVTAVQRKDSPNHVPAGVKSVKVDLSSREELQSVFQGKDAVISAVPNPVLVTERAMIDASIAASVKRIIPSEYSTNMESPLSRKLPIIQDKLEIRRYIESVITSTDSATTWTSINCGPFLNLGIKVGFLGPSIRLKKAIFHDGGDNTVCSSSLTDIATAVLKVLEPAHMAETANKAVYIYSAPITERKLTEIVSKATGMDFGTVENGKIANLSVDQLKKEADEGLAKGDSSKRFNYYTVFMYGKGYGGDFRDIAWNDRLGIRVMNDQELEQAVRDILATPKLKAVF